MKSERVDPVAEFKDTVHRRDSAALRRVLEQNEDARAAINEPLFSFDSPALVSVAGSSDVALVDVLLEFGADPNRKSSWWAGGFHPLYGADEKTATALLAAGAVPDMCAAAHLDRPDLLRAMLDADPQRVHERGGDGQMPLHFARSRTVVDLLLEAGADIDARDIDHRSSAAEWMLGDGRAELARYLVDRGAAADIFMAAALGLADRAREMLERDPGLVLLRTGQGDYAEKPPSSYHIYLWTLGSNLSPLHVAGKFRQHETLEVLKSHAPPIEQLLFACSAGDAGEARRLAAAQPGFLERLDTTQRRALTDEAWNGNAAAVRLLMELGFDPSVPSLSGPRAGTALHSAAWQGSVECVEAILAYPSGRALVNIRETNWNGTPLSWCCHGSRNCGDPNANHAGVARALIAAGAEVTPGMMTGRDCAEPVAAAIREASASR